MTAPIDHAEMTRLVHLIDAGGRLAENVEVTADGCIEWLGCVNSRGYGVISSGGRRVLTHRVSYEIEVGPIPDGLQIDHLCRNKRCVNPAHLEAVTALENNRRKPGVNKTHCVNGHEMTEANTIVKQRAGRTLRNCRACNNEQQRARYAAKQVAS